MPQVLLKGCEGTHGKSDCSGFFQCSLLLMQLEQCKKGSDKQEKSDYRFMPQLWQFQTQGREKEEQQIKIIEIFFFYCILLKARLLHLELGLKFMSPKTEILHFEANYEHRKYIFSYFVLFHWIVPKLFADKSKTVLI